MAHIGLYADLAAHIDPGTYCLNEKTTHPHKNLFNPDERFTLRSDADEQLLLSVPFKEKVKVFSITLSAPAGATMPTSVKIFANMPTLGFAEAEDTKPTQEIELNPEDLAGSGTPILLRFVKFQTVDTLQLFFENDNPDAEFSELATLSFAGTTIAGTNMGELKAVG